MMIMPLKGIYIEDDDKNLVVTLELFRQEGFEMETIQQLPANLEEIYPLILELQADFLLVDHELNKKVSYTGYDALKEIRKHDSTIYAILLTNFRVEDFKAEFGSYDLEIHKSQLSDDDKLQEISAKIRRACERSKDIKVLAQAEENRKFAQERLEILRQIHETVKESL